MSGGYIAVGREVASAQSFDYVFSVHWDYVYKLTLAMLGNEQDAEDVTQEVFLKVYKALPSYKPELAGMRTWLTKITVNTCSTHRKRNIARSLQSLWRRPAVNDAEDAADSFDFDKVDTSILAKPEDHALQNELRGALKEVLAGLSREQRTAMVLHYYMDMSAPEIASVMDCPENTIYSRLHHARRAVQAQIERRALNSKE